MAFSRNRSGIGLLVFLLLAGSNLALAQEFDELDDEQQALLAPLSEHWDQVPEFQKRRLLEMSSRVANRPVEEQERFQQGLDRFISMDGDQRKRVRQTFERFKHLPPGERRRIIQRVTSMSEDERQAFAFGIRVADRTRISGGAMDARVEAYMRGLSPEERSELLDELKGLSGPDRLRRLADALEQPPAQGEGE